MSVLMYLKPTCPFCKKARQILSLKGAAVTEIDIAAHPAQRAEMIKNSNGRTTVPQIFINDTHIGGCDDLVALNKSGKLDEMLP